MSNVCIIIWKDEHCCYSQIPTISKSVVSCVVIHIIIIFKFWKIPHLSQYLWSILFPLYCDSYFLSSSPDIHPSAASSLQLWLYIPFQSSGELLLHAASYWTADGSPHIHPTGTGTPIQFIKHCFRDEKSWPHSTAFCILTNFLQPKSIIILLR